MFLIDNTLKLIGMKDVIVGEIVKEDDKIIIPILLPVAEQKCPRCGNMTQSIHDYREQNVLDLDAFGKKTIIRLRKRRYRCGVCKKRFAEYNEYIKKYQRTTQRLFVQVVEDFASTLTATQIANRYHISTNTALRYFDIFEPVRPILPKVLSIDEFKGNADREKYQTKIVDPESQRILDILPNRKENDLVAYFLRYPKEERLRVNTVVIDMNGHFNRVIETCFPNAQIVLDRFHVVRQVHWALENTRKNEQKCLSDRFRKYFKHSRFLLHKNRADLSPDEADKLTLMLNTCPRLAGAYLVKEKFHEVMNSTSRAEASRKLSHWFLFAEFQNMPELKSCITCYHNWASEILDSVHSPYSNGYIEGTNNKTKVLKRICFGIRRFDRLKRRILFAA